MQLLIHPWLCNLQFTLKSKSYFLTNFQFLLNTSLAMNDDFKWFIKISFDATLCGSFDSSKGKIYALLYSSKKIPWDIFKNLELI